MSDKLLKAYLLQEDGGLEFTNYYDPSDSQFLSDDEVDEIEAQFDAGNIIIDLHGRVFAINPRLNTNPVLLADYSDEITKGLHWPSE